jgi:hypothetical protein
MERHLPLRAIQRNSRRASHAVAISIVVRTSWATYRSTSSRCPLSEPPKKTTDKASPDLARRSKSAKEAGLSVASPATTADEVWELGPDQLRLRIA